MFQNDGSRDVEETTASQFLMLRELSETVDEGMLAKAVLKLCDSSAAPDAKGKSDASGGARAGSVKRVMLVRDRRSEESWRFGFVEFMGVDVGVSLTEFIPRRYI